MNKNNFNEEDKQRAVEFLNMVAQHAEFKLKTDELIKYFKLLAHMQQSILPKIDANIIEIKRIIEPEKKPKGKKAKGKKGSK